MPAGAVLPPRLPESGSLFGRWKVEFCDQHDGVAHRKFTIVFSWVATFVDNDLELGGVLAASLFVLLVVVNVHLIATCGRLSFFPKHVFDRLASLCSHIRVNVSSPPQSDFLCRRGCVHRMDRQHGGPNRCSCSTSAKSVHPKIGPLHAPVGTKFGHGVEPLLWIPAFLAAGRLLFR